MLEQLAERMTARKEDVLTFKKEVAERIEAHMRDSAILKAWIEDSLQLYADELGTIVNGNAPAPAPTVPEVAEATAEPEKEIADAA